MKLSKKKLINLVEERIENSRITLKWLTSIHLHFANHCKNRSESEGRPLSEILYWEMYGKPECPICGQFPKYRGSIQQGYSKFCSSLCAGKDPEVRLLRIETNQKKYGVNSPTQVPEIRIKQSNTMLARHGVKYGGQKLEFVEQAKETLLHNHGVVGPLSSPELLAKARSTWTENWGVSHPMKNREYFENQQKAGFKIRKGVFQGKEFSVRGFELAAIKWLVYNKIKASNILHTSEEGVPTIQYFDKIKNKQRHYHPDFLVKRKGIQYLVEVKSTYTAGLMSNKTGHRSGEFSRVKAKAKACVKQGWKFKLLIVSKNKKEIALISNIDIKSRKEVIAEYKNKTVGRIGSDM